MKTTVKQIASLIFIALLLLVGNVKAEGTETKDSSYETVDLPLLVENWMTNETIWDTNSLNNIEFTSEMDAGLELEAWMTNSEVWDLNNNFVEELEDGMQLEAWMTSGQTWNVENINAEEEEALTVEDWMIDSEVWK